MEPFTHPWAAPLQPTSIPGPMTFDQWVAVDQARSAVGVVGFDEANRLAQQHGFLARAGDEIARAQYYEHLASQANVQMSVRAAQAGSSSMVSRAATRPTGPAVDQPDEAAALLLLLR